MATIKEVAKAAGTSPSTVSRVLNGVETVDPVLVERVQLAAKQLNYQFNLAGRSLRTGSDLAFGPDFEMRSRQNEDVKRQVARRAVDFVDLSDVIVLDSGSTVAYMVTYLPDGPLIYTYSLAVLQPAAKRQLSVHLAPGLYVPNLAAVFGTETELYFKNQKCTKYFFSTARVDVRTGLFNQHPTTCAVKRAILAESEMSILLVDHTKFIDAHLSTYATLSDIDVLITDFVPEPFFPVLQDAGVRLVQIHSQESEIRGGFNG